MDAKELRIGNYITLGDIQARVSIIEQFGHTNAINELNQDMINPIELTEQWLKDFGFKHVNTLDDGTKAFEGKPYLYFKDGVATFPFKTHDVKYIHQLQNLYFALTGKELTTK